MVKAAAFLIDFNFGHQLTFFSHQEAHNSKLIDYDLYELQKMPKKINP